MKHTKGPWKAIKETIVNVDNELIAILPITRIEDARLMAAAPELLEACKWAENIYAEYMSLKPDPITTSFKIVCDGITEIRKAIAKAEGK